MPIIRFFLADTNHPFKNSHSLWNQPLPDRNRHYSTSIENSPPPLTYGEYFNAVADFCASNAWNPIRCALEQTLHRNVAENEISKLDIFLEKHGALYHPARISVAAQGQNISFVVNVAASAEGRRTLPVEIQALKKLQEQRPFDWIPKVYGGTDDPLPMFLADWFDGYHEFHLTHKTDKQTPAIMVWDGDDTPCLLSRTQADTLYRQASMILTTCFDPLTSNQIYPWHHAAGDFVVRIDGEAVDVKLITVRGHAPAPGLEAVPKDDGDLLNNLVAFLLHLSIRMRLDRIDGISQIVWAPETCITPIIDGFFKGMDLTARLSGFPETFPSFFQAYFLNHQLEQVMDLTKQLVQTVFDPQKEETQIVSYNLEQHVRQLFGGIGTHRID